MLYPLTPSEHAAIAKMALDDRIEQLREAMQALDALKKQHPKRKRFEHDIFRAARGLLLPLRKVDPLRNPTEGVKMDETGKLSIAIRAGRVVFTPIGAFECVSQEQALEAIRAINSRTEQTDSARLAIEADAPAILKDAAKPVEPTNPWQAQQ